ncbi:MAG: endonuclease III domain-containing protein [Thermomicrobiales bacterium]
MDGVREAVRPYPNAVLHELAELGHTSLFEQVVACIISIRTLEEVTMPAAKRLFEVARTPAEMLTLSPAGIEQLIRPSTFYERKAHQILTIAERAVADYDGDLPCDDEVVRSFSGVGPKCANLALGIACGLPRISVDIHVHRVTNRWGYVTAKTPEQTLAALEAVLPEQYAVEINALLVPFGKYHCTRNVPKCSTCPVLEYCRQVGVTTHR